MPDLPHRELTLLPAPPGGSADARRRGRHRRRRQGAVAAGAVLVVAGSALGATLASSGSALDRVEPAPFASSAPRATGAPAGRPTPPAVTTLPSMPVVPPVAVPALPPLPAQLPRLPRTSPTAEPEQSTAPAQRSPQPRLVRSYDPPSGQDATVCGGRVSSGIGPPRAQTGWCTKVVVAGRTDGADLAVEVCRSSEGSTADLHVDAGAVTMRVERDGEPLWSLPVQDDPAATLRTEPAGCWRWTWAWDGRGDDGQQLDGSLVLLGAALADEVRDIEDQASFSRS